MPSEPVREVLLSFLSLIVTKDQNSKNEGDKMKFLNVMARLKKEGAKTEKLWSLKEWGKGIESSLLELIVLWLSKSTL